MMKQLLRISLAVALLVGATATAARAGTVGVGDPAPKLEVKSFVKGEPVSEFEPGKIYVVEFWATWCGPCRASIPHLTELQKKNANVTFIGVSVWEQDQGKVKPFVDEMGDKMAYRVAMDAVPEKEKADKGAMAESWMTAAGQDGIPTAFVINKEGKVAWIGHPMSLDEPLQKIVSGSYDLDAAKKEHKQAMEDRAKIRKLQSKFVNAFRSGDPKKIVAAVDEIVGEAPTAEEMFGMAKLAALVKLNEEDKALEYAEKLAKSHIGEQAQGLNGLAWTIVAPESKSQPSKKLVAFALETARRADEKAASKDPAIADTLARVYFVAGDLAKAIETQERAVNLAKGTEWEKNPELKDRLDEYKKAAAK